MRILCATYSFCTKRWNFAALLPSPSGAGLRQVIESGRHPLSMTADPNFVFCYGCGSQLHRTAPSCPKCGAPQPNAIAALSGKNRVVAAVLAFLLGGIGIHKFYLGQVGRGILYLLFCWTLIPGVIALVEGFIYLFDTDEAFARKHPL